MGWQEHSKGYFLLHTDLKQLMETLEPIAHRQEIGVWKCIVIKLPYILSDWKLCWASQLKLIIDTEVFQD